MEEKEALCWCGSGKAYTHCHQMNDAKLALLQSQGQEVPSRDMIKTPEQIAGIREACAINTAVLDEVAKYIKAGMTTEEINTIVYDFTIAHDAVPAPLGFCGFPKSVCTSVNDQVCHGIPSEKDVLRSGDIVNVDVSTIYKGYYADASRMFMIGKVKKPAADLVAITKQCLLKGIEAAQPWRGGFSAGAQARLQRRYRIWRPRRGYRFSRGALRLPCGQAQYRHGAGSRYDFYHRAHDQYGAQGYFCGRG